jgi:hypothetical protein
LFVPGPGPNWKVEFGEVEYGEVEPVVEVMADWSFEPVVVLGAVPAWHELEPVVPDWSHELLGVVVVLDCVVEVVVVGVVLGPIAGVPLVVVVVLPVPPVPDWLHEVPMSLWPHGLGVVVVLDGAGVGEGAGADGGAGRPPLPPLLLLLPDWSHDEAPMPGWPQELVPPDWLGVVDVGVDVVFAVVVVVEPPPVPVPVWLQFVTSGWTRKIWMPALFNALLSPSLACFKGRPPPWPATCTPFSSIVTGMPPIVAEATETAAL